MKRPQQEDVPKAPTKWVLVGHSLGTLGVELVRSLWEERHTRVNGQLYGVEKVHGFGQPSFGVRGGGAFETSAPNAAGMA